jgi:hypothetical protein
LAGQLLDTNIRENSGEGVGGVEVTRAFRTDLKHHRNLELTEALNLEVVPAQRTQIT